MVSCCSICLFERAFFHALVWTSPGKKFPLGVIFNNLLKVVIYIGSMYTVIHTTLYNTSISSLVGLFRRRSFIPADACFSVFR